MKKVITRVEFEWDNRLQEYVVVGVPASYYTKESFALCDSGDSGDDSSYGEQTIGDTGQVGTTGRGDSAFGVGGEMEGLGSGLGSFFGVDQTDNINNAFNEMFGTNVGNGTWTGGTNNNNTGVVGPSVTTLSEEEITSPANTTVSGARGSLTEANMPTQDEQGNYVAGEHAANNGYTTEQMSRANNEYQGLSYQGAFNAPVSSLEGLFGISHNSWGFTNLNSQQQTNWGQIGNDIGTFLSSPFASTVGALTGYGAVTGALGGIFNASQGRGYAGAVQGLGGMFGLDAAARAGLGIVTNFAEGRNTQAITQAASTALGMNGLNFGSTLNNALGNDRGSLASAITSQVGNMAQSTALGYGVGAVTNAVSSNIAGTSELSTGVSNQGSAISSTGFNLAGGIDNNGGTGQFDLNKGIVGSGLSALGVALLTGNNNMATNTMGSLGALGASLYGQYGDNYSSNLQGIAAAADPTQYNALLAQSYTDPKSVYDSQYAPMDKQFYGDMMANASVSGRTTDAYKHGLARESQFQNFLNQYRTGLSNIAQGRLNTYTGLQTKAADNTQGLKNTTSQALGNLFGTATGGANKPGASTNSSLNGLFSTIAQGGSATADYLSNLFSGYYTGNDASVYQGIDEQIPAIDTSWFDQNAGVSPTLDSEMFNNYDWLDR